MSASRHRLTQLVLKKMPTFTESFCAPGPVGPRTVQGLKRTGAGGRHLGGPPKGFISHSALPRPYVCQTQWGAMVGGEGHTTLGAGGEKMTRPGFEGGVRVPWLEGAKEGVVAEAGLA